MNDQSISDSLKEKFEFYNFGHALEILTQAYPNEWNELLNCLDQLRILRQDLRQSGGNESPIPKKIDDVLYPL